MRKKTFWSYIYIIFISALTLTSCMNSEPSHNAEQLFAEMYKDCSMNKDLRLSPEKSGDNNSKDMQVLLESISDSSVIFPAGFNIHILQFDSDENNWIEKGNRIQYLPLDAKYIIGKSNPKTEYSYKFFSIRPMVAAKTPLRIVLYGHIYKNGVETEECSGAFTDIVVVP